MLCTSCRRQLSRGADYCGTCGAPVAGAAAPLELVLADQTRVPLVGDMTIGRAPSSTVVLADPSVSRLHARISPGGNGNGARIEDAGSSAGTSSTASRSPRRPRSTTGRRCSSARSSCASSATATSPRRAARSSCAPARASSCPRSGRPGVVGAAATSFGMKPRVRSGYALKRLDASEGSKRWVLRDLSRNTFLRLSDNDAQLFELLDGTHSLADLIGDAEQRYGAAGAPRLARLLADLGERGYLAGVAGRRRRGGAAGLPAARCSSRARRRSPGSGGFFDGLYRRGGWVLFTQAGADRDRRADRRRASPRSRT